MTDMREERIKQAMQMPLKELASKFIEATDRASRNMDALKASRTGGEVEPTLTAWVLFDSSEVKKYIKKYDDGSLALFDTETEAKIAKRKYPHTDYKRVEYYTRPAPAAAVPDRMTLHRTGDYIIADQQLERLRFQQGYNCCIEDNFTAAPQPVRESEKEKALQVLRDNVRDKERGVRYQGLRDNDAVRDALHVLLSAQPPEGER